MAQLDVQPKRHSSWWLWIIFFILALGVAVLLYKGCNRTAPLKVDATDTTERKEITADSNVIVTTQPDWNSVDFNIPKASYNEVTDTAIIVKGNDQYTIYSLGENVLFPAGKSNIQPSAEAALEQISNSLKQRFKDANIAVYGHTDSTGASGSNKVLAGDRANAVKEWLITKGEFNTGKVSVQSLGEEKPLASNNTKSGRALNRSVEIVAYPDKAAQK
ncbi:OmpA family protein [Mucilaginibacter litoreus]|uniref:OmpA family protein n=1 Tax=Mucilaginibacter litoreus TaxID=1048221 RepID=A0ABW3AV00_9SPHI